MKYKTIITAILVAALCASCSNKLSSDQEGWKPKAATPIQKIEVTSGGTLIETYEFAYDDEGRILSLSKKDAGSGKAEFDYIYSYDGSTVTIKDMASVTTPLVITAEKYNGAVSYHTSHWQSWTYTTTISGEGVATSTVTENESSVTGGWYTSRQTYCEEYDVQNGNILSATFKTATGNVSSKGTTASSSSTLTVKYGYSGEKDVCNFNAFIMDCELPVWFAAGLPGSSNLISDIKVEGVRDYMMDDKFDYVMDAEGRVSKAVRTSSSEGKTVCTITYSITYFQ